MNSKQKTVSAKPTPRQIAENMPAPKPGMNVTVSLEVLCYYTQIHDLKLRLRGDMVVASRQPVEEKEDREK